VRRSSRACEEPAPFSGRGVSSLRSGFLALFDIGDAIVEDFPNEAAEAVGDSPDCPVVGETRQEPAEEGLEVAALLFHGGLSGLGQDSADKAIPFGRPGAVIFLCADFTSGAQPSPGGELSRRSERFGIGSHFGNKLLCRVHSESRDFGHPGHCVLVLLQGRGGELVQPGDLLVQQVEAFQIQFQEFAMD